MSAQGCSHSSKAPPPAEASPQASGGTSARYRVGSGDVLEIQVFKEPDCSGEFPVDSEGMIAFCYVGKVAVAGKDLEEVHEEIVKVLEGNYLKEPRVKLELVQFGMASEGVGWMKNSIRIIGEVAQPGIYQFKSGYSVLDAILEAGGFTEFAAPNRTRIVRFENGEKLVLTIKVKEMM
jgi:polysaccharide export outer membrane protein